MILKKPFAFLIKHFKLIHVVLAVLSIYLINSSGKIYAFFREFIENDYSAVIEENFVYTFINAYTHLAAVIIILIVSLVIILLSSKNKKHKLYIYSLIFYVITLVIIIFYSVVMKNMETELVSAQTARVYRDIILLIYAVQYIFAAFFIIRALGFNLKHFNFNYESDELQLNNNDNEEMEINFKLNTEGVKKGYRKYIRELGYYFKEHYLIIILLFLGAIIFVGYSVYIRSDGYNNETLSENQVFYHNELEINILDSFITKYNQSGTEIKEDTTFLVLVVNIKNSKTINIEFNKNELKLNTNSKEYIPSSGYSNSFSDYGKALPSNVPKNSENIYIIPYIIEEDEIENFKIEIYKGSTNINDSEKSVYTIIDLDPHEIAEPVHIANYEIGETLDLKDTELKNSNVLINDFELTQSYYYDAEKCDEDQCTTYKKVISLNLITDSGKSILVLDSIVNIDQNTVYYSNNNNDYNIVDNFMYVEYTLNETIYREKVSAIENDEVDNKLFVKVSSNAKIADTLKLIIVIRNKEYHYILK